MPDLLKIVKTIPAVETLYKGYKFRSRVEARWAVAFDVIGIKYNYELEGLKLDNCYYLPDFYLSDFNCWVEIKGKAFNKFECNKCIKLTQLTKEACLLLDGPPDFRTYVYLMNTGVKLIPYNTLVFPRNSGQLYLINNRMIFRDQEHFRDEYPSLSRYVEAVNYSRAYRFERSQS